MIVDSETGDYIRMVCEPKSEKIKGRSKPAAVAAVAPAASTAAAKPKPKAKSKRATRAVGSKRRSTGFNATADEIAAHEARERDENQEAADADDDEVDAPPEGGFDEDAMAKELDVDDSDQVPEADDDSKVGTRLCITSHLQMLKLIAKMVCRSHKLPLIPISAD